MTATTIPAFSGLNADAGSTDRQLRLPPMFEQWHDYDHGQLVTGRNRNYWGVTFARDGDHFFATRGEGLDTWLVEGSISQRTLHTVDYNVACPSLSPDGSGEFFHAFALVSFQTSLAVFRLPPDPIEFLSKVLSLAFAGEEVAAVTDDPPQCAIPSQRMFEFCR